MFFKRHFFVNASKSTFFKIKFGSSLVRTRKTTNFFSLSLPNPVPWKIATPYEMEKNVIRRNKIA